MSFKFNPDKLKYTIFTKSLICRKKDFDAIDDDSLKLPVML